MALTIAAASVAATLLVHGAMFFVVWLFSLIISSTPRSMPNGPTSPFDAER